MSIEITRIAVKHPCSAKASSSIFDHFQAFSPAHLMRRVVASWKMMTLKLGIWSPVTPPRYDLSLKTVTLPECDISVSKLLGFETFPIFGIVSDSVSEKFGIKISIGFDIGKNLVSKKVSDSVSEIIWY